MGMAYADIQKRIRKRKIRFRIIFTILILSVILVFLFSTPVFKVKKIVVEGNNIVSSQKITELSDIKIGDNLLRLNTRKINANIKTNTYISASKIIRSITGSVCIKVEEREAAGIAKYKNDYVTLDKKGVIIEVLDKKDGVHLPLISGLDITDAVPGKTAQIGDTRKLDTMEIIFDTASSIKMFDIINEVELENLLSITIKTQYGIDLKIGDISDITEKLGRCKAIMDNDLLKKKLKGTIDVSFKGNPVFRPVQN